MSESVWRKAARAAGSPNLRASDSDRDRTRRSESVASCLDTSGQLAGMATWRRPRNDSSIPVNNDARSVDPAARSSSLTRSAIDSGVPTRQSAVP